MLTRIALDEPGTAPTLEASGDAVTALARHGLMAMVEPFMTVRTSPNRVENLLDPDSVIDSIHIAAGLGATSARTWLKLPVVDEMDAGARRHDAALPAARRRPQGRPGRHLRRVGPGPRATRPPPAWSSAAPCSSRPTATSPSAVDVAADLVHGGSR